MRGGSVHFAPRGGVGMRMFQSLLRAGTIMLNAIHLPSGDHWMLLGFSVRRVSWLTAPSASMYRTKTCVPLGSPFGREAMRVPSGDHCAFEPFTSARFFVPSTFMIHSDDCQAS